MGTGHEKNLRRPPRETSRNPCMVCGACCTVFRASFYWAEGDDATPGGVPVRLTVRSGPVRRAMRRRPDGRCVALRGVPGRNVSCAIYARRPSTCRTFRPHWAGGPDVERCEAARARLQRSFIPECKPKQS